MSKRKNDDIDLINENSYSRKFNLEIYEEWENSKDIIKFIEEHYKQYAYIYHDKDIWTEEDYKHKEEYMNAHGYKIGDEKKPHYHAVVCFTNPRYKNTVAKELNIDSRFIVKTKKYRKSIEYLIHENEIDKYHYNFNEVKGPLLKDLLKFIRLEISEEDKSDEVINLILSKRWYLPELVREINKRGLYVHFRQGFSIYKIIYEENNCGQYYSYKKGN